MGHEENGSEADRVSFTANPFLSMTIVEDSNTGDITWDCDSCGGRGDPFTAMTRYQTIRDKFNTHLRQSHKLTKDHTQGWYAR